MLNATDLTTNRIRIEIEKRMTESESQAWSYSRKNARTALARREKYGKA